MIVDQWWYRIGGDFPSVDFVGYHAHGVYLYFAALGIVSHSAPVISSSTSFRLGQCLNWVARSILLSMALLLYPYLPDWGFDS